ncbi:hypothetical protein LCGC14_1146750 [marine sediment metagenome]|uniref:Uncharacterized protein n=1 Tax=marine sediment metagenome TaxID=412755 RepID=A0A0F9MJV0_9ZZZZ
MANKNIPTSPTHNGWWYDALNARLEFYFRGTKVGHLDASGFSVTDDTTARMTDGLVQNAGMAAAVKRTQITIGSHAAVASNGAGAVENNIVFTAPAACKLVSAWCMNISASDVTTGAAASYRRAQLICNTAAAGSGTDIIASANITASAALRVTRGFTTVASTIPAGGIVLMSHLTVGAESANRTDAAARYYGIEYELT